MTRAQRTSILFPYTTLFRSFCIADGSGVRDFCEVVSIKAGDVILICAGDCFLCLDDLQIVRDPGGETVLRLDRKSTRLNSSHLGSSYAVFCLKKKDE